MDVTNLDAIEFVQDNKKQFRVYYQTKESYIRESCYHADDGWFTAGNGIVTTEARENSPITVTRWNEPNNKVTQIRVYFLDGKQNIREAKGVYEPSNGTTWSTTGLLKDNNKPKVGDGSQLSIARPDSDDTTLKIFYQEPRTQDGQYPIREFRYSRAQHQWVVVGPRILGGIENTRISAVSDRKSPGDIRLYFQGNDNRIWESYWNYNGNSWSHNGSCINDDFVLIPKAPISAVSWYINGANTASDLRIRIYTILSGVNGAVTQVSYNGDEWDENAPSFGTISDQTSNAVASARNTSKRAPATDPVSLFYRPNRRVIGVVPVKTGDTADHQTAVNNTELPQGIPTSRTSY